jgi:hypothetical protein
MSQNPFNFEELLKQQTSSEQRPAHGWDSEPVAPSNKDSTFTPDTFSPGKLTANDPTFLDYVVNADAVTAALAYANVGKMDAEGKPIDSLQQLIDKIEWVKAEMVRNATPKPKAEKIGEEQAELVALANEAWREAIRIRAAARVEWDESVHSLIKQRDKELLELDGIVAARRAEYQRVKRCSQ